MRAYTWDGSGYAAVVVQRDVGCNYALGCGIDIFPLKGETSDAALADLRGRLTELGGLRAGGEYEVERAYVVTRAELAPVAMWVADATAQRARDDAAAREASERAEYERLRRKFGK